MVVLARVEEAVPPCSVVAGAGVDFVEVDTSLTGSRPGSTMVHRHPCQGIQRLHFAMGRGLRPQNPRRKDWHHYCGAAQTEAVSDEVAAAAAFAEDAAPADSKTEN